jgi:hypothetical protein
VISAGTVVEFEPVRNIPDPARGNAMPHRSDLPLRRIRAGRWLLAGGVSAALIAIPVASQHDPFGIVWRTALAGSAVAEHGSFRGLVGRVRGAAGRAFGLERRDERLEQARARYTHALDLHRGREPSGAVGLERRPGPLAYRLSPEETRRLIEHGWRPGRKPGPGFRSHRERGTLVELSKRLGHGAQVGAAQETSIAALAAELAMTRGEPEANPEDPEAEA